MSIKQNGGVFGRNPTFNDVTIDGELIINGETFTGLDYQGAWNATTNAPALVSSVGTLGEFYIVSVAGATNLNGITNWDVGDWALFSGSVWQRVEGGANGNFSTLSVAGLSSLNGGVDVLGGMNVDSNTLVVDDVNNRVGIGTSSPSYHLVVSNAGAESYEVGPGFLANRTIFQNYNRTTSAYIEAWHYASQYRWNVGGVMKMTLNTSGDLNVVGALSKGSGSFKIPHPLKAKKDSHHLVHSFIEGPQADNIYRGRVTLSSGSATVNIDSIAGMTEGTFSALNRDIQVFTSNESTWDAVIGSVDENILTIQSKSSTSSATVSWMVIGERKDQHMYDTGWTDSDGKVIVEPEIIIETTENSELNTGLKGNPQ